MQARLYCQKDYIVDSSGFVISKKKGTPLKPQINPSGYKCFTVMVDKKPKTLTMHQAIAKTFLGDRSAEGMVVNHIDGDKLNNDLSNLEWVTPKENVIHARDVLNISFSDYKRKPVILKNEKEELRFDSLQEAARYFCKSENEFKSTKCSAWRAVSGNRKTYKGYKWSYYEPI